VQTLAVVGYSDTGKTMVTRQLAIWFKQQGVRLAVVKHAAHGYEIDTAGKDSHSYYAAGAEVIVVAGPDSFTIHRRTPKEASLDEICEHLGDCELVLVEGYKNHPGPKVELLRRGVSEKRLPLSGVVAVVTDLPDLETDETIFSYHEIELLAQYLYEKIFRRASRGG